MFESRPNFGLRKEVPAQETASTDGLKKLIADVRARIENGTHVPDDAKLLEKYESELAEMEKGS